MNKSIFIAIIGAMLITSCSPKIVGSWNVDRYEVDNEKGQNIHATNAGEITFRENGTGEREIRNNLFLNEFSDFQDFKWKMQSTDVITISGENSEEKSDLDKTWIIVTAKKKKQVWKSTDGRNSVQTLELSKK